MRRRARFTATTPSGRRPLVERELKTVEDYLGSCLGLEGIALV